MPDGSDLPAVMHTEDWARIQALPIRDPSLASMRARGEELSAELTPQLLREGAADPAAKLKWIQALALWEIFQGRGAYLGIPVGEGKTLISWLAAYILDCDRTILILPEGLFSKTEREFHKLAQTWVAPPGPIAKVGIKALQREENVDLLERLFGGLGPNFVVIDECDLCRNQDGSVAKRLDRYRDLDPEVPDWPVDVGQGEQLEQLSEEQRDAIIAWCEARGIPYLCMTGTGTRFSILDFSHFLLWARDHAAPVPRDPDECAWWAKALDEKSKGQRGGYERRPRAGALLDLIELPAELEAELTAAGAGELGFARAKFMHRLRSTPGVIITDEDSCDQPLHFNLICAPEDPIINGHFETFRKSWELPNGQEIIDSLSAWAAEWWLGCGGFSYWLEQPPEVWRDTRRAYAKKIRAVIEKTAWSADPLDTAKAVAKAFPNDPIVELWRELKPTFKPKPAWQWESASVVNFAAQWATENVGTVWVQSIPVGEAIAQAAGIKFYGAQGLSADGSDIEYAPAGRSLVAGILSNSRGRNLQDRFNRGLAVQCPQSGDMCQQLFGRLHRFGQTRPVQWDILITSGGSRYAWDMATREAKFVHQTQSQKQKILRGSMTDCIFPSRALRWARKAA
jgi:hypothetical protein